MPLGWTSTYAPYTTQRIRLLEPSRLGLISYCIWVQYHFIPFTADVEMDAREVREVSSTWTLREQGEFFNRM